MIAVKTGRRRTKGRSRMGSWALSVVGFAMVAIMGLMIASADQSPYGATPVWSAEPTGTITADQPTALGNPWTASTSHGQGNRSLPAATLIRVGVR